MDIVKIPAQFLWFHTKKDGKIPLACGYNERRVNVHHNSAVPANKLQAALREKSRAWLNKPQKT